MRYTIDLRTARSELAPCALIAFEAAPVDANGDTWFESVLRINIGDRRLSNPFGVVELEVAYDAQSYGMTNLNIGDSRANNGGGGDGATRSDDAETDIGREEGGTTDLDRQNAGRRHSALDRLARNAPRVSEVVPARAA